ncbi:MAG: hypothetical protein JJ879_03145 [Sneathiella sp.]|nr:hypothetical protein [Sneathiella sp.]
MVKISGTLSSNVSLSGRLLGGQGDASGHLAQQVKAPEKPAAIKDERPDMTFSGLGRRIDISV